MKNQSGFIQAIIIVVVALIALGYFGFNMSEIVKRPAVQQNLSWAGNLSQTVWERYLSKPIGYAWDTLVAGAGRAAEMRLNGATSTSSSN
jgi:hypothetical protein